MKCMSWGQKPARKRRLAEEGYKLKATEQSSSKLLTPMLLKIAKTLSIGSACCQNKGRLVAGVAGVQHDNYS
jgi:hypothetical protein